MKSVFVRYEIKENVRRCNNAEMCNIIHASDILDIPDDKVDDKDFIERELIRMYGFIKEYIIIKYIRLWQ